MKSILIIGNSITAVSAIKEIRRHNQDDEITLLCEENIFPYQSALFADLLAKTISEDKIFYQPKDFFEKNRVKTILSKKIQRIDFRKNRVITEDKEQYPFDSLAFTSLPISTNRFGEVKGVNKMGVFGLNRFSDLKDVLAVLHVIDTVAINVDSVDALKIAGAFKKRGKDVILITNSSHLLSFLFDKDSAQVVEKILEENEIRVIHENTIVEVLGEGEVKALRLKSGKVMACQMIILPEQKSDLRIFHESPLQVNQRILVNENFRSSVENIFAAGAAAEGKEAFSIHGESLSAAYLQQQGLILGQNILGQNASFKEPLAMEGFDLFGKSITRIGLTKDDFGISNHSLPDQAEGVCKTIFIKDHAVIGAFLVNAGSQKDYFQNLIISKASSDEALGLITKD